MAEGDGWMDGMDDPAHSPPPPIDNTFFRRPLDPSAFLGLFIPSPPVLRRSLSVWPIHSSLPSSSFAPVKC